MKRHKVHSAILPLAALIAGSLPAEACTNFLVSAGASIDGSTMITYAADAHVLYGELYFTPAGRHVPGSELEIFEWDTGKRMGVIEQVPETYAVVGNMNEHQVAIGETTFGGREELSDPEAIMDYGSLIYVTLQRARTAREAIKIMTDLANRYGYYSSGESMSIADRSEVWLLEIIGKGPKNRGAVWVARRVPDGYITGHANNPRIRTFPRDDPESTLYAPDVISFAREMGYFDGADADFSFADAYAPLDYGAVRFCDARVWSMYRRVAPAQDFSADWVTGVPGAEPLPLWIKPDHKLSVHDVMQLMRDHFEGTPLDMSCDIGAGPFGLPYRWRPLTWTIGERKFFNERATSTQQTGFSFVSQSRSSLPDPIGGVLWFGVDDTYSTVYVPMYCGISRVPASFAVGTGSFDEVTWDAAFWVFNQVSNFAYLRYNEMIKDIQKVQHDLESRFLADQADVESAALALYAQSPRLAVDYLTDYSVRVGDTTVARWRELSKFLLYKYLDGNRKDEHGKVTHPGYPQSWYERVAAVEGDRLALRTLAAEEQAQAERDATNETRRRNLVDGVLALLAARAVNLDAASRQRISDCRDHDQLTAWLVRAAEVSRADALFAGE